MPLTSFSKIQYLILKKFKTVKLQNLVKYLVLSATSDFYENASIQATSMKLGRDIPWAWGNYFGAKLALSETFTNNLS